MTGGPTILAGGEGTTTDGAIRALISVRLCRITANEGNAITCLKAGALEFSVFRTL